MHKLIFTMIILINSISTHTFATTEGLLERLPNDFRQLEFKEVGKAKFSVLFWDIYNSALYTKSGSYLHQNSAESLLFKIDYLKDITTEDLIERTVQQWQHLEVPESTYTPYISKLKAIWPNISAGDSLTLLVDNGKSVFYFNNEKIGAITAQEFSRLFLDIWLSPATSQAKLRSQLLGGNNR